MSTIELKNVWSHNRNDKLIKEHCLLLCGAPFVKDYRTSRCFRNVEIVPLVWNGSEVRNVSQVGNPFAMVPKFRNASVNFHDPRGIGIEDDCNLLLFVEDQPATLINLPLFNLRE